MTLKAGDWVEVRAEADILGTLDAEGRLDGMPFMPEMLQFCGKKFRVKSRAHKTCDPIYTYASRRVDSAVHLDLRCDGSAHGGCQTGCLFFWKEAWLKPLSASRPSDDVRSAPTGAAGGCTIEQLSAATRRRDDADPGEEARYVCQTTCLNEFSERLSCWDLRQYVEDYTSGNVGLTRIARGAFYVALGRRFETTKPWVRTLYNSVQRTTGGAPSPSRTGTLADDAEFPRTFLDLRPGDLVKVKSHDAILATIRRNNFHRGLYFDVDMVPYCGGTFRVKRRVERFIDEKTGRMRSLKTPAVILDNVYCTGQYSTCRMFCPRALHSWWREEWLELIERADRATSNRVAASEAGSQLAEATLSASPHPQSTRLGPPA